MMSRVVADRRSHHHVDGGRREPISTAWSHPRAMSLTRRPTVNLAGMQGQSSRQQLKSVHAIFGMITLVVGILGLVSVHSSRF
jgi:hypothetical protein